MNDIDTNITDTAAVSETAPVKVSPFKFTKGKVIRLWVFVGLVVTVLHYTVHQSPTTDAIEFGAGGLFMTWFYLLMCKPRLVGKEQVTVVETKPSPFTPAMFTPFNVVKMVTVLVAPVVAVLHFTIHQSLTTDAVEFVLGGAFIAWFFLLLCKPHLVDKIPDLGRNADWDDDDELMTSPIYRSFACNMYHHDLDND